MMGHETGKDAWQCFSVMTSTSLGGRLNGMTTIDSGGTNGFEWITFVNPTTSLVIKGIWNPTAGVQATKTAILSEMEIILQGKLDQITASLRSCTAC